MRQSGESALAIAGFLERHARVERVLYRPRLAPAARAREAPDGAERQRRRDVLPEGGIVEARRFLERLEVFTLAESLGGVESLVDHPAIMTHASVRRRRGEARHQRLAGAALDRDRDTDDLVADLASALG